MVALKAVRRRLSRIHGVTKEVWLRRRLVRTIALPKVVWQGGWAQASRRKLRSWRHQVASPRRDPLRWHGRLILFWALRSTRSGCTNCRL